MRWLIAALRANGIDQSLPLDEALDVAEQLVASRRAIPPGLWVESLIQSRGREELDSLL
jgi:hypothetical protein